MSPPRLSKNDHGIDIREEAGVRYLHFGSDWVQGAMRIARPWSLELAYTREMMASLLFHTQTDWPKKCLLIGLGAASLVRFIYRYLPHCQMTVAEINPSVVAAARQFFKLPEDESRLEIQIADGASFVEESVDFYDLILVDGFDANARCGKLNGHLFYTACRRRLSENGILVCNLLGRSRGFQASVDRLNTVFDDRAIVFPSCDSGNAVAFASQSPLTLDLEELRTRAQQIKTLSGLNLGPSISRLQLTQSLAGNQLRL